MCMEDIKIDRALRHNTYRLPVGTFNIPANPRRISLRLIMVVQDYTTVATELCTINAMVSRNQGDGGTTFALLQVFHAVIGNSIPEVVGASDHTLDHVHIHDIGDIIKNPLQSVNLSAVPVYLLETYLDAEQTPPFTEGHL